MNINPKFKGEIIKIEGNFVTTLYFCHNECETIPYMTIYNYL